MRPAKGPAGRAWNGGWNGRNDGVDVFPHPDGPAKYAIGGIEPGEWVQYTVTARPGLYALRLRYGGEGTGGRLRVSLNGVDLAGSITLPGTGGWGHVRHPDRAERPHHRQRPRRPAAGLRNGRVQPQPDCVGSCHKCGALTTRPSLCYHNSNRNPTSHEEAPCPDTETTRNRPRPRTQARPPLESDHPPRLDHRPRLDPAPDFLAGIHGDRLVRPGPRRPCPCRWQSYLPCWS